MTATKCKRAWEAEAMEDGRLVGELRDAFVRHAATCRDCARERAALDAIRGAIADLREPSAPALQRRRLRAEVLRNANDALVLQDPWWRARPYRLALAGVVAIVALVLVVGRFARNEGPRPRAATNEPAHFDVADVRDADWRSERDGLVTRMSLRRGTVAVHVETLKPGQRFIMTLPDGELEVHGTRFTVRADDGRTQDVEVTEGIVALRIHGRPERRLQRGDRWVREVAASTSTTAPPPPAPPAAASPPAITHPLSSSSANTSGGGNGSSDFALAMAAFSGGAYAEADDRLGAFIARHPADPRSEDAAFLRAVSRARMGDRAGAAARARAYLRSYPNGLRRHEAEAIVDGR